MSALLSRCCSEDDDFSTHGRHGIYMIFGGGCEMLPTIINMTEDSCDSSKKARIYIDNWYACLTACLWSVGLRSVISANGL